jgi:hypothetical protein
MVLFVHDINDILLEFSKCNFYLKRRNGLFYTINDQLATIAFLTFTVSWYNLL